MIFIKVILAAIFFISSNSFAKNQPDSIVAKVNNQVITYYDLQDRYLFLTKFAKIKPNSAREKSAFLSQIIDKMVDEELIRQEGKTLKLTVSKTQIKGAIEGLASKKNKSYASFKSDFKNKNISFSNFKEQVRSDLLWSKIIAGSLRSRIKITDLEIKEFFEQKNFNTDVTKYKISEIFIKKKKDARLLSQKIYQELNSGASFEDFVRQFSQSPTSQNNGEIGWVSKSDINKKIHEGINELQKGQYSKPILLSDGYYIFKIIDKKVTTDIDKESLKFARNRIFMKELEVEGKSYMMDLRKKSFIEIYHRKFKDFSL